jgi:hypothetical protein
MIGILGAIGLVAWPVITGINILLPVHRCSGRFSVVGVPL